MIKYDFSLYIRFKGFWNEIINDYVVYIWQNRYGLVFVPFTVIDHHKSSVTVGAGLLSTEDVPSYKWLLQRFLEAHGNKHPALVLTDQCPSLKQAVESVFPNSKHRLCMWHIMKKLPKKVSSYLLVYIPLCFATYMVLFRIHLCVCNHVNLYVSLTIYYFI